MLKIVVPKTEFFDESIMEFVYFNDDFTIRLEHSLVSISKWESKWHIPFLGGEEKSSDQVIDYIRCMTITQNVPDEVYKRLTSENLKDVNSYIDNPMTATIIYDYTKPRVKSRVITSELIYFWMISLNIPMECEKWHLNRLLTLIKVCDIEGNPKKKKMSRVDTLKQNSEINERRKKMLNTSG